MNNGYGTHDLYLAAFLRAKGYLIADIKHNGNGRATFVFEDKPERNGLILEYYNGQGLIEPLAYVNALKDLKALTYNL